MKKLKIIDLFAGAGGLSLGFKTTGKFELVAAAEINKNARLTYEKNIVGNNNRFIMIDDIVGYDFLELKDKCGDIDVVIGGPPCQGFSNANRQKNSLISLNNNLIKEYFRAIKQIRPKAFILENVSMLQSSVHRFYESNKDVDEINLLIKNGCKITKRLDSLLIAENLFSEINLSNLSDTEFNTLSLPTNLNQLLSVLNKNINNTKRLSIYLDKHKVKIINCVTSCLNHDNKHSEICSRLSKISIALKENTTIKCKQELDYIVKLQNALATIKEISDNKLIGKYSYNDKNELIFIVNSYSVIDYIKAILDNGYIQFGKEVNAKFFGIPQDRKRYITIGVRRDILGNKQITIPTGNTKNRFNTVSDAINDLSKYPVGYDTKYQNIKYQNKYESEKNISKYALLMRKNSDTVKNHIITKTTKLALERFKTIKQGKNFHSLSTELKSSYSKPERTQNTIYLRLDPNKPCGTVVNVRKSMWIHPTLDRAISIREAARLQSFPDNFEFIGTKDSQYQQIGNAVPPILAKAIAKYIFKILDKN